MNIRELLFCQVLTEDSVFICERKALGLLRDVLCFHFHLPGMGNQHCLERVAYLTSLPVTLVPTHGSQLKYILLLITDGLVLNVYFGLKGRCWDGNRKMILFQIFHPVHGFLAGWLGSVFQQLYVCRHDYPVVCIGVTILPLLICNVHLQMRA